MLLIKSKNYILIKLLLIIINLWIINKKEVNRNVPFFSSSSLLQKTKAGWMKSRHEAKHTSEFPWTSAGCSSSLFPAAWRSPPGTDAAAYYHPLSVRERKVTEKKFFLCLRLRPTVMLHVQWVHHMGKLTKYMHMKQTLEVNVIVNQQGEGGCGLNTSRYWVQW